MLSTIRLFPLFQAPNESEGHDSRILKNIAISNLPIDKEFRRSIRNPIDILDGDKSFDRDGHWALFVNSVNDVWNASIHEEVVDELRTLIPDLEIHPGPYAERLGYSMIEHVNGKVKHHFRTFIRFNFPRSNEIGVFFGRKNNHKPSSLPAPDGQVLLVQGIGLPLHESALLFYGTERVVCHNALKLHLSGLPINAYQRECRSSNAAQPNEEKAYIWKIFRTAESLEITLRLTLGPIALYGGAFLLYHACGRTKRRTRLTIGSMGIVFVAAGLGSFFLPVYWQDDCDEYDNRQSFQHNTENVPQNVFTF